MIPLGQLISRLISCLAAIAKHFASSGNRTRAARVAGEHSTTEPTMLSYARSLASPVKMDLLGHDKCQRVYCKISSARQYALSKLDEKKNCFLPGGESNPGLPRDRRGY